MTTTDLLQQLQAWTEGRLTPGQTQQMLTAFLDTPVWFPGTRQTLPDHPGKSIHRLHPYPGPRGGLPTLPVWFENPATSDEPDPAAMLQYNAGTLLVFVMTQRFNVRMQHGAEECVLLYDDLLNLRTLMLLRRVANKEVVEPTPVPNLTTLLPALLDHCRKEPAIQQAWIAVVSSLADNQVTVMVNAPPNAEPHLEALDKLLDPLLPPGVSLNVIDAAGNFNPEIRQAVQGFKPLHDVQAKGSWFSRLKDALLAPAVVPVVELSISPDGSRRPSA